MFSCFLNYRVKKRCTGVIGIEVVCDIVVKLILGKMDGDDLRHCQKADGCLLQLSFFQIGSNLLLAFQKSLGNLSYLELTLLKPELLLQPCVGDNDTWKICYRYLMEEDITLKQLTPHQESGALPHLYGSCRGLGQEARFITGCLKLGDCLPCHLLDILRIRNIHIERETSYLMDFLKSVSALSKQTQETRILLGFQIEEELPVIFLIQHGIPVVEGTP